MGILSFFAPQKEEQLHRALAEILAEYHKVRAILERQRAQAEHLRNIHMRMDGIQAAIRHANTIPDRAQRLAVLQQHVMAERPLLALHKNLAAQLEQSAKQIERFEKRAAHAARRLRSA